MAARQVAEHGADADAERIQCQKAQPAEQRTGAVRKAESHADDDSGKRDLRFATQHPDQERNTDIDQELRAAADMACVDTTPECRAPRLLFAPRVRWLIHAVRLSGLARIARPAGFLAAGGGGGPLFFQNPSQLLR